MQVANKLPPKFDAVVVAPFGAVGIFAFNAQISIELLTELHAPKLAENKIVQKIVAQIKAYFCDANNDFSLQVAQYGTPYQQRVWKAISAIPRGRVLTYGDIAAQIGSGPRAVANACGANNLPLLVPCHRVIAKNGLGGFMQGNQEGLKIKKWLLRHEDIHY